MNCHRTNWKASQAEITAGIAILLKILVNSTANQGINTESRQVKKKEERP